MKYEYLYILFQTHHPQNISSMFNNDIEVALSHFGYTDWRLVQMVDVAGGGFHLVFERSNDSEFFGVADTTKAEWQIEADKL